MKLNPSRSFLTKTIMSASYPTIEEATVVAAAEKLMIETMARYDPSHDAYHGSCHPALPRIRLPKIHSTLCATSCSAAC